MKLLEVIQKKTDLPPCNDRNSTKLVPNEHNLKEKVINGVLLADISKNVLSFTVAKNFNLASDLNETWN